MFYSQDYRHIYAVLPEEARHTVITVHGTLIHYSVMPLALLIAQRTMGNEVRTDIEALRLQYMYCYFADWKDTTMLTRTYRIIVFGKKHYALVWQDHLDGEYQDTGYCTDHRGIIKQFDTREEADDYLRDMQDAEDI